MCHVLIIEDEALVAMDLQDVLSSAGATTFDLVETERGAIAAARAHRPDVIMSDVMLREGSGSRAVYAIQGEMGPVPVIFITARPEGCSAAHPNAIVLAKPVIDMTIRDAFRTVAPI